MELDSIVTEVRKEVASLNEDRKLLVDQYLSIVEATMFNQSKIMESYEGLVKKLENQVITC